MGIVTRNVGRFKRTLVAAAMFLEEAGGVGVMTDTPVSQ
jgi:hypothetical protein